MTEPTPTAQPTEPENGGYEASSIQVLEGLEAVRKRPGMYIGSTGPRGLHHLVWEVVDNSVDEALAGYCDTITVTIHKNNSVTVQDNGRGIPVEFMPQYNMPALEVVMTKLHAGGKFSKSSYKVSGGLHGVGISVVNALSSDLLVTVVRNGSAHAIRFSRGIKVSGITTGPAPFPRGTRVTFTPDPEVFDEIVYDYDVLATRLRELSFLNAGLTISVTDERSGESDSFRSEGGIGEFVAYVSEGKQPLHEPIAVSSSEDEVAIDVAVQYNAGFSETVFSFVNNINTIEGGSHLSGFRSALTRAINQYLTKYMPKEAKQTSALSGADVREGLAAIIAVKVPEPQFEGQTKTKLGNSEVQGIVNSAVFSGLVTYFDEHPSVARMIIEKCLGSARARHAAQKARELVRRKSMLESSSLPGKLADCSTRDRDRAELYIVEGDSAGGSAKQARSRDFQAILPLRGKILNVEKSHLSKAIKNREIQALITAIGTSIADEFDLEKLRYGKIVIMTDADVDGAHIRTLLLTFFYRFMPELVDNGKIYIAQPPLYKMSKGRSSSWLYSDKELAAFTAINPGYQIQRYKGLGEMNADQLWETTMDPEVRSMLKVTVEDAIYADKLFTILMGTEVEPRREFIEKHALEVENLDL